MNKHYFLIVSSLSLLLFFLGGWGCRSNTPADMPKLYPCTVTIEQDGRPLSAAIVVALSFDPALSKWAASGVTNESGLVELKTHGKYPGVAEGEFKVLVTKTDVEKGVILAEESETTMEKSIPGKTFTLIEEQYGDAVKTPLSITVKRGKTMETFNVGKAIRKEIESN